MNTFTVKEIVLSDNSRVYDVMVIDAHGLEAVFWHAHNQAAAEACADAMNLMANNWR